MAFETSSSTTTNNSITPKLFNDINYYYNRHSNSSNEILLNNNIMINNNSIELLDNNNNNNNNNNFTKICCKVCLNDCKPDQIYSMKCKHQYCLECWKYYLESKINNDGMQCIFSKCIDPECKLTVDVITFKTILDYSKSSNYSTPRSTLSSTTSINRDRYFQKYCWYLAKDFIDNCSKATWCTNPNINCDNIIYYNNMDTPKNLNIKCNCNWNFCFHCGQETHFPATCKQIEDWKLLKSKDEGLNFSWLNQNTKKCPNCKIDIEKNHGCVHMICSHCKFGFCWLCMGSWKDHGDKTGGFFSCNKYYKSIRKASTSSSLTDHSDFVDQQQQHHHQTSNSNNSKIEQHSCINSLDDLPGSQNYQNIKNYMKITNKFLMNLLDSTSNMIITCEDTTTSTTTTTTTTTTNNNNSSTKLSTPTSQLLKKKLSFLRTKSSKSSLNLQVTPR
ncbi:hypothetical protein PPL_00524 [Heterostelium album PN500]|uniref:RBR-type E3 ubiquitin transferase n=1 Tax=Heterostelium pallidum (strain ATCC 26659 / Pp 5 / PN500) TaxID=670386 RepID=D3AWP6_HETP5|nr:hypothetical protein PPL_00524 [Heterostelium album PN500]EFA86719.1 hypothetical protein PPL_00524 [Heterostelium album PN500]|eukprot:XP_020438823.1 hypothetical protein PPL_00524 [Heterostelium album PN500]